MCRGCVIILILFLIAEGLRAQPIHLAIDSIEYIVSPGEDILELQNYVVNNFNSEAPVQWMKTTTAPASWTVNLCDDVACYTDTYNSSVLFIAGGDSSQLKGQFFVDEPGEGLLAVTISAQDVDGSVHTINTSYSVLKTTDTSIPVISELLKVYPNPVDQYLTIENQGYENFELSSLDGRNRMSASLARGSNQIRIKTPAGRSFREILRLPLSILFTILPSALNNNKSESSEDSMIILLFAKS